MKLHRVGYEPRRNFFHQNLSLTPQTTQSSAHVVETNWKGKLRLCSRKSEITHAEFLPSELESDASDHSVICPCSRDQLERENLDCVPDETAQSGITHAEFLPSEFESDATTRSSVLIEVTNWKGKNLVCNPDETAQSGITHAEFLPSELESDALDLSAICAYRSDQLEREKLSSSRNCTEWDLNPRGISSIRTVRLRPLGHLCLNPTGKRKTFVIQMKLHRVGFEPTRNFFHQNLSLTPTTRPSVHVEGTTWKEKKVEATAQSGVTHAEFLPSHLKSDALDYSVICACRKNYLEKGRNLYCTRNFFHQISSLTPLTTRPSVHVEGTTWNKVEATAQSGVTHAEFLPSDLKSDALDHSAICACRRDYLEKGRSLNCTEWGLNPRGISSITSVRLRLLGHLCMKELPGKRKPVLHAEFLPSDLKSDSFDHSAICACRRDYLEQGRSLNCTEWGLNPRGISSIRTVRLRPLGHLCLKPTGKGKTFVIQMKLHRVAFEPTRNFFHQNLSLTPQTTQSSAHVVETNWKGKLRLCYRKSGITHAEFLPSELESDALDHSAICAYKSHQLEREELSLSRNCTEWHLNPRGISSIRTVRLRPLSHLPMRPIGKGKLRLCSRKSGITHAEFLPSELESDALDHSAICAYRSDQLERELSLCSRNCTEWDLNPRGISSIRTVRLRPLGHLCLKSSTGKGRTFVI
eukprot:284818136_4